MADQKPGGIDAPSLGSITSSLGSYKSSGHTSLGGSSGSSRGSQFVSLSLIDFVQPDVEDYERRNLTDPDTVDITPPKSLLEQIWDGIKETGATIVVGATSILSGVAEIAENVIDGAAYLAAGAMDLVGLDDAAKATREFIARDWVDEANDALYGEGGLLQGVNEASHWKYDSEEMQGLRSISKKVGKFALATVLTVCSGGLATAGVGFLCGLGEGSEDSYQKYGVDLNLLQNLMIIAQGGTEALSWYSSGKLGKGLTEIYKSANLVGIYETLLQMKDEVFNKEFIKKLFSKGNVIGNIISSLAQAGGEIGDIARRLVNGEEVSLEEWGVLLGDLLIYFGLNTLEDAGRTAIIDFKINDEAAMIIAERLTDATDDLKLSDVANLGDDSIKKILDNMSPEEIAEAIKDLDPEAANRMLGTLSPDKLNKVTAILEGTSATDSAAGAGIKAPDLDSPKEVEVPKETDVDTPKDIDAPEDPDASTSSVPGGTTSGAPKKFDDDDAIKLAEDILDPNSPTGFESVKDLTDEELRKVLDCMTPEEMAKGLPSMDAETAARVQNMLDGEETTRFVGQVAQDLTRGEMDPKDVTKLDDSLKLELQDRSDLTGYDGTDRQRIGWYEQEGITSDHADVAESNYRAHQGDFTSEEDYYGDLSDVEAQTSYEQWRQNPTTGKWEKVSTAERIPDGDPGITSSVTEERMAEWGKEVDKYTHKGETTVHVGNNNPKGFEKYVLGQGDDYGTLGVAHVDYEAGGVKQTDADGWQFASLGDGDGAGMVKDSGGTGTVRKFESDLGLPEGSSDRMIMTTYDVDRADVEMPTGREIGSNNQRLPGGRTPNGNTEAVHQTIHISGKEAKDIKVEVVPNDGDELIWSGTLAELKQIQKTNPKKYAEIMGY